MKTILLMALTIAFTVSAAAECTEDDKKALIAFDHAWGDATRAGDRAALMNIYADGFTGLPGMQNKTAAIDGAVTAAERNKSNPNADKTTYDHYLITCTPNSATITHRNTVWTANGTGGKPETFYTRSVHVLEKSNGKWQVVSNAGHGLDEFDVIWYLEQDWNDAIKNKDKDWFEKNFAADFTNIGTSGELTDRKANIAAGTVNNKSTYDSAETSQVDIRIDGHTAVVTGVFRIKGKDEKGEAFDKRERYTDVWIKRDGRWQAWSSQGTAMK